ncbi:MAG TPA: T9SS type A sorting domain-containing protein, partial [Flavobacteriales bacterium]|nr:T9SS type A sorting domain-containing protein [Flavobacteriales bacterium]
YGDGSVDSIFRTGLIDYPEYDLRVSYYASQHMYSGNGAFTISCRIPNRNVGIINIPNSVTEPLSVDALIVIDPVLGMNNSIRFDSLQTNWYMTWNTLVHEPGAYEVDGDSVAYELVTPLGTGNSPIPGYAYPSVFASNYVWVNPLTGRLLWDQPTLSGEYVVAIRGSEYRNGQLIGQVTRDVEIQVIFDMLIVGVTELEPSEPLTIQPSQASSVIQFDSGSAGNCTAQLFNTTGALVSTLSITTRLNTYIVNDLDPGMYVLRIHTTEGNTQIGRFVKE